ncbi:DNA polymerase III subunit epsilon, partial [Sinorhizobium meliloti]
AKIGANAIWSKYSEADDVLRSEAV